MNFTEKDLAQIKAKGLTKEQVESQINQFVNGVPKVRLASAATVNDGIIALDEEQQSDYIALYQKKKDSLEIVKFIPASGAASRMFKQVYQFVDDYNPDKETIAAYISRTKNAFLDKFFSDYKKFPFYYEVWEAVQKSYSPEELADDNAEKYAFVKTMMGADALDLGSYPKGLLPFHNYESFVATAFEEHLFEAAAYASQSNRAILHFTVSPQHETKFKELYSSVNASISNMTNVAYEVSYSFQKPKTDTIAVTPENELFRDEDGQLLFRPGGHGALIENLNEVDADLIFIKNIDNVLVQDKIQLLARYKKILAGVLIGLQEKAFLYAEKLDEGSITETELEELITFLKEEFSSRLTSDFDSFSAAEKHSYLLGLLNRPIRVCGMVKNVGDPGGGPFWVTDESGKTSLQIIESAQIDLSDSEQEKIFSESTHFNPVDVVCGVRNYKGEKYELTQYVDPDLAFIAEKTVDGSPVKALELPGLWNGAMADWNTTFVEVPLETFNPVKTVNDLLKPEHQAS